MGLKELAVEAYKKEIERIRKEDTRRAEEFVVQAEKILKERIGNEFNTQVISKDPCETIFDVEGIKFRVNNIHEVCIIKKCERCETEYYEDIMRNFGDLETTFQGIGKILSEPHDYYECKRILEEKEKEKEGNKEPTTDEKLLQALKDFMHDNIGECIM